MQAKGGSYTFQRARSMVVRRASEHVNPAKRPPEIGFRKNEETKKGKVREQVRSTERAEPGRAQRGTGGTTEKTSVFDP